MILVTGLTPAWQQITVLDRLQTGGVNRAREVHWCASGKVLNVGRALTQLGASVRTLSLVGSGPAGDAMRRDMQLAGADVEWIDCSAPQRTCTTLLDSESGTTTEIVENFGAVSTQELDEFAEAFRRMSAPAVCDLVVLTGSMPSGTSPEFVSRLLSSTPAATVLDLRGPELLAALPHHPWLVKPNRDELAATVGRTLATDDDVWQAMSELGERGAQNVIVTDGPRDVLMMTVVPDIEILRNTNVPKRIRMRFRPAPVKVVNPIGCGDCFAAGFAWLADLDEDSFDAIQCGLLAAEMNAEQLMPAQLDVQALTAAMASATRIVLS